MKTFFEAHRPPLGPAAALAAAPASQFDPACEDALLEAFAK